MSAKMDRIVKSMTKVLKTADKSPSPYDTQAEVVRVDGDTAWVHIAGGVDETPVKMTINAKAGDTVQVRVAGGDAWLTGNGTAPPTDDTRAEVAVEQTAVVEKVVRAVQKTVASVSRIAGNTAQYFWHTEEGTDTGVHITEIPKEEFLEDPSNGGGNLLARSNGVAVRDGLTEVATFGADGVRIGKDGSLQSVLTEKTFSIAEGENSIAHIGYNSTVTDVCVSDGSTTTFTLSHIPLADGVTDPPTVEVSRSGTTLTVTSGLPSAYSYFTYTYETTSYPNYSFGKRRSTFPTTESGPAVPGNYSFSTGYNTLASGNYAYAEGYGSLASGSSSHAEGYAEASGWCSHAEASSRATSNHCHAEGNSTASGSYAHSEGYSQADGNYSHSQNEGTIAAKKAQTAIGTYNVEDESTATTHPSGDSGYGESAFIIGNGTSTVSRSNAFAVDWNGNVTAAGNVVAANIGDAKAYTKAMKIAAANTWYEGATLPIINGAKYVVTGTWQFAAAAGSPRVCELQLVDGNDTELHGSYVRHIMGSNGYASVQVMFIGTISTNKVAIRARSNQTTSVAADTILRSMRIR